MSLIPISESWEVCNRSAYSFLRRKPAMAAPIFLLEKIFHRWWGEVFWQQDGWRNLCCYCIQVAPMAAWIPKHWLHLRGCSHCSAFNFLSNSFNFFTFLKNYRGCNLENHADLRKILLVSRTIAVNGRSLWVNMVDIQRYFRRWADDAEMVRLLQFFSWVL